MVLGHEAQIDLIYASRQLYERMQEYSNKLILIFINIEEVYDSVKETESIWESLAEISMEEEYTTQKRCTGCTLYSLAKSAEMFVGMGQRVIIVWVKN